MSVTMQKPKAEQPEKTEGRQSHPVKPEAVAKGHLMAFVYYAIVDSVSYDKDTLNVHHLDAHGTFSVNGRSLIERSLSADQYHVEEKVSKTQAAEILVNSFNRPFTVCFEKQDGSERVLRGRLIQPEPLLGRSYVEDLDVTDKNRLRLVDHRTIRFLIVDGVRYNVK